jgi:diguanylate cyclase (GGDEF)-like protein
MDLINKMNLQLREQTSSLFQSIPPRRFAPEMEAIYRKRQNERALFVTRLALMTALVAYVLFGFWDYWFHPASLPRTLPVRVLFSGMSLLLWTATFLQFFRERIAWVVSLTVISTYIFIMWVLNLMPDGLLYGMVAFAYPHFVSLTVPNLRLTLFDSAILFRVFYEGGFLFQVSEKVFLNGNFLLFPLCIVSCLCAFANEVRERHVFQLEYNLEHQATTDSLCGAFNRRYFMNCAHQEVERAQHQGHPLSLLLIDIDHFKQINDSHGHRTGDDTICAFAQTCQKNLRNTDILGRVGGEEFAILLPETDPRTAKTIAERIRQELSDLRITTDKSDVSFTVSIGVALLCPSDELDSLLHRADVALYKAKEEGRNRVILGDFAQAQQPVLVNEV